MTAYRRKFRERPGELTPRNLDHPELVGLEDTGGGGVQEGPDLWEPLAWALLTPSSCSPPHWLWPVGCGDGAAVSTHCFYKRQRWKIWTHFIRLVFRCGFVATWSWCEKPWRHTNGEMVSLLHSFASITGTCEIKKVRVIKGCPLSSSLSHELWLCRWKSVLSSHISFIVPQTGSFSHSL